MARATTATGIVLSVSGQTVTVDLDQGGSETVQKMRHVSVSQGDLAHIITVGRARFVDGVIGSGNAPTPEAAISVPPPAPDQVSTGSWPFGPILPGTWRDGDWLTTTALLWQGSYGTGLPQYGAAWYGEGPASLPGDLTGAMLTLIRVEGVYGLIAPTVALYAGTARPDGPPTILDTAFGAGLEVGVPVDWPLPAAWLPLLQAGTAGGLGCYLPSSQPALALTTATAGMSLTCSWMED